jgi:CubicO group peptidase (beta-lactamase class C family)
VRRVARCGRRAIVVRCASAGLAAVIAACPPAGPRPGVPVLPAPEPLPPEAAAPVLRAAAPREVGFDPDLLLRVDSAIFSAIAEGAAPGAALAVGRRSGLVRLQGYGVTDPRPGYGAATATTIYDLASLTKVVATTMAAMLLVDAGLLGLDDPLHRHLREWGDDGARARVTIRHLLAHTSGLPAGAPLWRELRDRDAIIQRIAATPLQAEPGSRTLYSDFGMILVGEVAARRTGLPLDELLERHVFRPLGMHDTGYRPLRRDPVLLPRIAPTELDTFLRRTHLQGIVHDPTAWAMDGVAGHAGLFSTARDLAVFAQMLLNGGAYGGVRILGAETIRQFVVRQSEDASRALGWDTPSARGSAGAFFPHAAFGHTGYTGTSVWIDPERDLFVVLLTNRVNPTAANQRHVPLRRAVHDLVQQAIDDPPVLRTFPDPDPPAR